MRYHYDIKVQRLVLHHDVLRANIDRLELKWLDELNYQPFRTKRHPDPRYPTSNASKASSSQGIQPPRHPARKQSALCSKASRGHPASKSSSPQSIKPQKHRTQQVRHLVLRHLKQTFSPKCISLNVQLEASSPQGSQPSRHPALKVYIPQCISNHPALRYPALKVYQLPSRHPALIQPSSIQPSRYSAPKISSLYSIQKLGSQP